MPNTGNYKIIIEIRGGRNKTSPVAGETTKTDEEKYKEKWDNSLEKGLTGLVSYGALSSTADKLISYEISQVELRTGAREKEQRMQTVYNISKKVVNSAVMLGVGAATGNLPLVAIGLMTSLFNSGINLAQNIRTLETKKSLESTSISMQNERAGVQGRRSTMQ